ncbi:MAG TPA: hypothetical protein DDX54_05005 [Rhodospirillaceae bacterium]|nr:hypothetical protein [Rhodospirillaceae bacterium]
MDRVRKAQSRREEVDAAQRGVAKLITSAIDDDTPWVADMLEKLGTEGHIPNDCDGHAILQRAVLEEAGVPPQDMAIIVGGVKITDYVGDAPVFGPIQVSHTALVVRDNNTLWYSDNNLEAPALLNPETMTVRGRMETMDFRLERWAEFEQTRLPGHGPEREVGITWTHVFGLDSKNLHLVNKAAFWASLEVDDKDNPTPEQQRVYDRFAKRIPPCPEDLVAPPPSLYPLLQTR